MTKQTPYMFLKPLESLDNKLSLQAYFGFTGSEFTVKNWSINDEQGTVPLVEVINHDNFLNVAKETAGLIEAHKNLYGQYMWEQYFDLSKDA
jgi:hypothetical protein